MIGNFVLRRGSTQPWLEVHLTQDGFVDMNLEAPKPQGCGPQCDPANTIDLTEATVAFNLFLAGREPRAVAMLGRTYAKRHCEAGHREHDRRCWSVVHEWDPAETFRPGLFYGQFTVTFPDNTLLKWPYQLEQLCVEIE